MDAQDKKEMMFLLIGLIFGLAGMYVGFSMNVDKTANTMAAIYTNQTCGSCLENVDILLRNQNILASKCMGNYKLPNEKNVSILPGVIDDKVIVNGP